VVERQTLADAEPEEPLQPVIRQDSEPLIIQHVPFIEENVQPIVQLAPVGASAPVVKEQPKVLPLVQPSEPKNVKLQDKQQSTWQTWLCAQNAMTQYLITTMPGAYCTDCTCNQNPKPLPALFDRQPDSRWLLTYHVDTEVTDFAGPLYTAATATSEDPAMDAYNAVPEDVVKVLFTETGTVVVASEGIDTAYLSDYFKQFLLGADKFYVINDAGGCKTSDLFASPDAAATTYVGATGNKALIRVARGRTAVWSSMSGSGQTLAPCAANFVHLFETDHLPGIAHPAAPGKPGAKVVKKEEETVVDRLDQKGKITLGVVGPVFGLLFVFLMYRYT